MKFRVYTFLLLLALMIPAAGLSAAAPTVTMPEKSINPPLSTDPATTTCAANITYLARATSPADLLTSVTVFLKAPNGTEVAVPAAGSGLTALNLSDFTRSVRIPATDVGRYTIRVVATTQSGAEASVSWDEFYCVDIHIELTQVCVNGLVSVTYWARTAPDLPFDPNGVGLYLNYLYNPTNPPVDIQDEDPDPLIFRGTWSTPAEGPPLDDGENELRVRVDWPSTPGKYPGFARALPVFCNIDPSGVGSAQYRP